jgi:hypothetical protein
MVCNLLFLAKLVIVYEVEQKLFKLTTRIQLKLMNLITSIFFVQHKKCSIQSMQQRFDLEKKLHLRTIHILVNCRK